MFQELNLATTLLFLVRVASTDHSCDSYSVLYNNPKTLKHSEVVQNTCEMNRFRGIFNKVLPKSESGKALVLTAGIMVLAFVQMYGIYAPSKLFVNRLDSTVD